ncbi:MAG: hypothetical protein ACTHK2_03490 [Dokdonella sp.]|uniref:hypothetical protein n=1 Tax=Dokdonella sp. TaxID=2291710 RepID=UPI003F7F87F3
MTQAGQRDVRDQIRVTRDVAGGAWRANLSVQDRHFDLVGGFETCDAAEPTGRTAIVGRDGVPAPVLSLHAGEGEVSLAHVDISGGIAGDKNDGAGVEYTGSGLLTLEDVSLFGNGSPFTSSRAALAITAASGAVTLRFKDRVSVSDNFVDGIRLFGDVHFESLGRDVEVSRNQGFGLLVNSPASFDLGGNGKMFAGNTTWGIVVVSGITAEDSLRRSRLFSTDANDPLRIHANGLGAILMLGNSARRNNHVLLTKNVSVTGHVGANVSGRGIVDVDGASVQLAMDTTTDFPNEADIACDAFACRLFGDNHRDDGGALVFVHNEGYVGIDRAALTGNTAGSVALANVGAPTNRSTLSLSNSLIVGNTLGIQVIGAYNGADVHALGLTIADNLGAFQQILVANAAFMLDVWDSIVDQDQPLLAVDDAAATTHLVRVLARNSIGASDRDDVIEGRPIYVAGGYRQAPDSPGVDRAPPIGGRDAADGARDVDTREIPDGEGPRDLGAYELQIDSLDEVFEDGFEELARVAGGAREVRK